MEKRFKELCEHYGYQIVPIATGVNGKFQRRSDVQAVEKNGEWVMTIPTRMYPFPMRSYKDLGGRQHPDYFYCEAKLYEKRFK